MIYGIGASIDISVRSVLRESRPGCLSVVRSSFDRGGLHAFDISIDLSTYLNSVCAGMICSVNISY